MINSLNATIALDYYPKDFLADGMCKPPCGNTEACVGLHDFIGTCVIHYIRSCRVVLWGVRLGWQVMEEGVPGARVVIADCPSEHYLPALLGSTAFEPVEESSAAAGLLAIVHLTPAEVSLKKTYFLPAALHSLHAYSVQDAPCTLLCLPRFLAQYYSLHVTYCHTKSF